MQKKKPAALKDDSSQAILYLTLMHVQASLIPSLCAGSSHAASNMQASLHVHMHSVCLYILYLLRNLPSWPVQVSLILNQTTTHIASFYMKDMQLQEEMVLLY